MLLDEFGLSKLVDARGDSLSGGERRRVEIARAIATEPAFLLLDEPFTGIDPIAVADIQVMIRQLRDRGLGVLITDHQVRETLAIVDRAYILNDGKIVVSGSAREVLDSPVARQFYLGEGFTAVTSGLARGNALAEMLAGIRRPHPRPLHDLRARRSVFVRAVRVHADLRGDADPRDQPARLRPARAARRGRSRTFSGSCRGSSCWSSRWRCCSACCSRLQRLSGESEITALKAGGVGLTRVVAPLLGVGLVVSLLALFLQEGVVPYANDRANYLREETIEHVGLFGGGSQAVTTKLPNGGRQLTSFSRLRGGDADPAQRDADSIRSREPAGRHRLQRARALRAADLDVRKRDRVSLRLRRDDLDADRAVAAVGHRAKPSQIMQRAAGDNPENMSRAQIRELIAGGQLSPAELRTYETTYRGKARAAVRGVRLHADRRSVRTAFAARGGGTGLGFGLAVAIVFVYFVIASICSAVFTSLGGGPALAAIGAWLPNVDLHRDRRS